MPRVMKEVKFDLSLLEKKISYRGRQKLYTSAVSLWPDRKKMSLTENPEIIFGKKAISKLGAVQ